MLIKAIFLVLMVTMVSAPTAFACENKKNGCGPFTNWYDVNWLEMTMYDDQGRGNAHWVISMDKELNDIIIEKDEHFDGKEIKGTLMIISGQIMLTKGLDLKKGYEIDAADGPGLMMQLLLNMLGHIAPGGPESINDKYIVEHIETKKPIKVSTASASGVFSTPWTAKGALEKRQENIVDYDINFESTLSENKKYLLKMSGKWGSKRLESLKDSMSLEEWKVYTIGPYSREYQSGTIYDYGASPTKENGYKTIGDIRAYIAAENHSGHRDPKIDFTGFWKEKCEQAFGLQIMHQGSDGKYSVVFCGPGGCGDPSDSRLTYITGDKRWEVVSEDELVQVQRSGERETYYRCTKDPHPVLKYK